MPINPHSASTSFYKNGMQACGTLGPREVAHMHAHLREQGDLTHVWPPCGRVHAVPGGRQNMLIHVKVGLRASHNVQISSCAFSIQCSNW